MTTCTEKNAPLFKFEYQHAITWRTASSASLQVVDAAHSHFSGQQVQTKLGAVLLHLLATFKALPAGAAADDSNEIRIILIN
jgi:hypothetical protein